MEVFTPSNFCPFITWNDWSSHLSPNLCTLIKRNIGGNFDNRLNFVACEQGHISHQRSLNHFTDQKGNASYKSDSNNFEYVHFKNFKISRFSINLRSVWVHLNRRTIDESANNIETPSVQFNYITNQFPFSLSQGEAVDSSIHIEQPQNQCPVIITTCEWVISFHEETSVVQTLFQYGTKTVWDEWLYFGGGGGVLWVPSKRVLHAEQNT